MNQILSRSEEIKGRLSTMFNGQQTNLKGCGPIYIPHTAEQLHSIVADAVSLIEAFQSELEVVKGSLRMQIERSPQVWQHG